MVKEGNFCRSLASSPRYIPSSNSASTTSPNAGYWLAAHAAEIHQLGKPPGCRSTRPSQVTDPVLWARRLPWRKGGGCRCRSIGPALRLEPISTLSRHTPLPCLTQAKQQTTLLRYVTTLATLAPSTQIIRRGPARTHHHPRDRCPD
jgi:hypothetical protein